MCASRNSQPEIFTILYEVHSFFVEMKITNTKQEQY